MIVRVAMIASLVALPALVSCRDNQERKGAPGSTTGAQGRSSSTYGGSAGSEGANSPTAQREGSGTSGGALGGSPSAGTSADPTHETGGTTGGGSASGGSAEKGSSGSMLGQSAGLGAPIASASLQGDVRGTVQFMAQDKDSKSLTALVNVQGAHPGAYGVYLYKGTDCTAIKAQKPPFASGKEVGELEDRSGWKSVGNLSFAQGQQSMQLPVKDVDAKDLADGRSVVIYPIDASAGAGTSAGISPVACGLVRPSSAGQPAG